MPVLNEYLEKISLAFIDFDNLKKNDLQAIKILIIISTSVISFNQKIYTDNKLLPKLLNETSISPERNFDKTNLNVSEKESIYSLISIVLSKIFKLLHLYQDLIKQGRNSKSFVESAFYFLKNFCKHFLSKQLIANYVYIFEDLKSILNFSDSSLILNFIFSFLISLTKVEKKDFNHLLEHNIVKIFEKIVLNCNIQINKNDDEYSLYVGKIHFNEESFNAVLEFCYIVSNFDPIVNGKYRTIFYKNLTKIILIKTKNNAKFDHLERILNFYVIEIENVKTQNLLVNLNEIIILKIFGYIKDLIGILSSITDQQKYKYFIEKMFNSILILKDIYKHNSKLIKYANAFFKLLYNLTFNHLNRISFHNNCKINSLTFSCYSCSIT